MVDTMNPVRKRYLIRAVIDKIIWDGENIKILTFGTDS